MIILSQAVILLCIIFLIFFSMSETAVISASRSSIVKEVEKNSFGSRIALSLVSHQDDTISTILIGSNIANISATVFITSFATRSLYFNDRKLLILTVAQTVVFLIFCEALPKLVSRFNAVRMLRVIAYPLWIFKLTFYPFVKGSLLLSNLLKKNAPEENSLLARDEIDALIKLGSSTGVIDKTHQTYVDEIMSLHKITVIEAMTPTINIIAVESSSPVSVLVQTITKYKFSRIPIYEKRVDDIIGYVYYRDILEHDGEIESIRSIMRKAVYAPLTKSLYVLYREMQNTRNYIVFAVNEFGAVVGMVTREDIVEEIVGEIQTRDHSREDLVIRLEDGSYSISGALDVDIFERQFGLEIDKKGFETVSGFVCYLAGRIPEEEQSIPYQGIVITVESSTEKMVKRIRVTESKLARKKKKKG